jgi:hypothetical protein
MPRTKIMPAETSIADEGFDDDPDSLNEDDLGLEEW